MTDGFLVPSPSLDLVRASIHELHLLRIAANIQYCHIRMRQGVKRYWCPLALQLMFHLPDRSCSRLLLQNVDSAFKRSAPILYDGSSRAAHIDIVVARKSDRTKAVCLPNAGIGCRGGKARPVAHGPGLLLHLPRLTWFKAPKTRICGGSSTGIAGPDRLLPDWMIARRILQHVATLLFANLGELPEHYSARDARWRGRFGGRHEHRINLTTVLLYPVPCIYCYHACQSPPRIFVLSRPSIAMGPLIFAFGPNNRCMICNGNRWWW